MFTNIPKASTRLLFGFVLAGNLGATLTDYWWPSSHSTAQPIVQTIQIPNGQRNFVGDIEFDSKGRILIAEHDLHRFDGRNWDTLASEKSNVQSIAINPIDDSIWLGIDNTIKLIENGWDGNSHPHWIDFTKDIDSINSNPSRDIWHLRYQNDHLYASIEQRLFLWEDDHFISLGETNLTWLNTILIDGKNYWSQGDQFFEYKNGSITKAFGLDLPEKPTIIWGAKDVETENYTFGNFGGNASIYSWDGHQTTMLYSPEYKTLAKDYYISGIQYDNYHVAVATFQSGIGILDTKGTFRYTFKLPIFDSTNTTDQLTTQEKDPLGNLFIGTVQALYKWQSPGRAWKWVREKIESDSIHSSDKTHWYLSNGNLFQLNQQSKEVTLYNRANSQFISLVAHNGQGLWGAFRNSVYEIHNGEQIKIVNLNTEIHGLHIIGASRDLIVFTEESAQYLKEDPVTKTYSAHPLIGINGANFTLINDKDQFWASYQDGTIQRFTLKTDANPSNLVQERKSWNTFDANQRFIKLTHWDNAIIAYSDNAAKILLSDDAKFNELPALNRWVLHADYTTPDGELYFLASARTDKSSSPKVVLLNLGQKASAIPNYSIQWIQGTFDFGTPSTLDYDETHQYWWIGGTNGLVSISQSLLASLDELPPIHLEVSIDEGASWNAPTKGFLRLPFETGNTRFRWFNENWQSNPPIEWETHLAGISGPWTTVNEVTRQFAGLREGAYAFEVRYRDIAGNIHPATSISFTIIPPWYRSFYAYLGYAVILIISIIIAFRVKTMRERIRREHLEMVVAQRTKELEYANAAKNEFVANMSHELRNPMNGIVGIAELLERSGLPPDQKSLVHTIRTCGEQLSMMIGDVLDFAKIEAGRLSLEKQPFSPTSMIEKAIEINSWDATQTAHAVRLQVLGDPPTLTLGDDHKITQIIVNYLSNACKYANPGEITMTVHYEILMRNRVRIRYEVADHGPGLSDEEINKVFERFYRSPRAAHSTTRGSGLGLAVCAEMADLMGGEVGVRNNQYGGSTFFLEIALPLPEGKNAHVKAINYDGDYVGSVLVADDMDYNRMVGAGILQSLGFTVTAVSSGKEALACLNTAEYDFGFLDFDMPDMTGPDIVRQFKAEKPEAHTRFFAVTAYATEQKRKICLDSGMLGFVSKPISRAKLREALLASGLEESALIHGTNRITQPSSRFEFDLEALLLLCRGDSSLLEGRCDDYVSILKKELKSVKQSMEEPGPDPVIVAKKLHRMISHLSIIKANDCIAAVTELQTCVKEKPRNEWDLLLERVEEQCRAVGVNLRRSALEYHLPG